MYEELLNEICKICYETMQGLDIAEDMNTYYEFQRIVNLIEGFEIGVKKETKEDD